MSQKSAKCKFYNISVEIWVQPLNVYGFLCLPGDLRWILIDYVEVGYGR